MATQKKQLTPRRKRSSAALETLGLAQAVSTSTPAPAPIAPVAAPGLNKKQTKERLTKAQKTALTMRKQLWPTVTEAMLWIRTKHDGYTTIPRTMPMFMELISDVSKRVTNGKSAPAGKAYLVLWCHVFDECIVTIEAEGPFAMEAGYLGERNVTTWKEHLRVLKELGFIDYKTVGATLFVLLFNPYHALLALKAKGWVQEDAYNALLLRSMQVGADEFDPL